MIGSLRFCNMLWASHGVTETHELKYRDIIRERENERERES